MCSRPDFELEEAELDDALWELFKRWKSYSSWWLDEEETDGVDWVGDFTICMRTRLEALVKERSETGHARRQREPEQEDEP